MHQEINSPDISKVYVCVFRSVKSPMRTLLACLHGAFHCGLIVAFYLLIYA